MREREREEIWAAHQRARFMRPDAARYVRPDAARYLRPDADVSMLPVAVARRRGATTEAAAAAAFDRELRQAGRGHRELRRLASELKCDRLRRKYLQKYNPGQPRVPGGNPAGGKWTSAGGDGSSSENSEDDSRKPGQASDLSAARRGRKALEAICLAQYAKDTFHCTMVGSGACHQQAALRLANCLTRKPIPPLNY